MESLFCNSLGTILRFGLASLGIRNDTAGPQTIMKEAVGRPTARFSTVEDSIACDPPRANLNTKKADKYGDVEHSKKSSRHSAVFCITSVIQSCSRDESEVQIWGKGKHQPRHR
jgi:hypothetical protein